MRENIIKNIVSTCRMTARRIEKSKKGRGNSLRLDIIVIFAGDDMDGA
jgi:stalled ribosome alternative rescue factor ArfA